ncbi:MAG TPA: DUF4230 domain-containing protein [Sphingobium sp.]
MKRFRTATILILILAAIGGSLWWLERYTDRKIDGSVETIATASLQGLKEQARLVPFVARFVAVTTSEQSRFGLSAKQTMILPGVVRYELDLNQITARDVAWDEATKTLSIYLPPIILTGPEIDLKGMQVYDGGGILMALTDAEKTLDAANKDRGQKALIAQARGAVPMRLARDAARSAIERSFAMPLRAAGIEARVTAAFK